jgi:hypothetical protein
MTGGHVWPVHFPDGCPALPHDGRPGTYFRLVVDSHAPREAEFLPLAEKSGYIPSGGPGARCKDCALSVFDTEQSALNFVAARPAMSAKQPVPITATDHDGVIHPDELRYAGHFLWWLPLGKSFFSLLRGSDHV